MFGDQGFFERGNSHALYNNKNMLNFDCTAGHNVSFSRSREEDLVERLDGIVSIPQEWHKKKVNIYSL